MPESQQANPYPVRYDLTNCDQEPIHLIRLVQAHARLLAADVDDLTILQASSNAGPLANRPESAAIIGMSLRDFLPRDVLNSLQSGLAAGDFSEHNPIPFLCRDELCNLVAHLQDGVLILEFEPVQGNFSHAALLNRMDKAVRSIQAAQSVRELADTVVRKIRLLTGYDRVMFYRFDENYNGQVVAEEVRAGLPSYLGLRYPSTDIPRQARELYRLNPIRLIADIDGPEAEITPALNPKTQQPLDLSRSIARGVSPIHVEYLSNMGVRATMSVSIMLEDELWGLIACHHYQPRFVDFRLRSVIGFIGNIIGGHLAIVLAQDLKRITQDTNRIKSRLFHQMSADWEVVKGLTAGEVSLLDLTGSTGAALLVDRELHLTGRAPGEEEVRKLIEWIHARQGREDPLFYTHELENLYPPAREFQETAAGVLAVQLTPEPPEYILWFRPEEVRTVEWGGKPEKIITPTEEGPRLSPRKSFEKWSELVRGQSSKWQPHEVQAALALRNDIREVIMRKFSEVRRLHRELNQAYEELENFSYTVSHDLRAPLRSIKGFAQILEEDYLDKLDEYGQTVLQTISGSVERMNRFISDILEFSRLGRSNMILNRLSVNEIVDRLWREKLAGQREGREVRLHLHPDLPEAYADEGMLSLLLENLLSNALKFSRHRQLAVIEVGGRQRNGFAEFYVRDNGIGFDMKYAERVFDAFFRLVLEEEYEGTGIGLAVARRIIVRHQGKIWVEAAAGAGAVFYFALPRKGENGKY